MIKLMIDLRVTPALLQRVTTKMRVTDVNFESVMNGPATNLVWTREPVVGLSQKFSNLYYMFGATNLDLSQRK